MDPADPSQVTPGPDIEARRQELQSCLVALSEHETALDEWRSSGAEGDPPKLEIPQPSWMSGAEYRRLAEVGRHESWRLRQRLIQSSAQDTRVAPADPKPTPKLRQLFNGPKRQGA